MENEESEGGEGRREEGNARNAACHLPLMLSCLADINRRRWRAARRRTL